VADIYETVDEDGQVVFTDRMEAEKPAKPVKLNPTNIVPSEIVAPPVDRTGRPADSILPASTNEQTTDPPAIAKPAPADKQPQALERKRRTKDRNLAREKARASWDPTEEYGKRADDVLDSMPEDVKEDIENQARKGSAPPKSWLF
jgi:hypothetical protein